MARSPPPVDNLGSAYRVRHPRGWLSSSQPVGKGVTVKIFVAVNPGGVFGRDVADRVTEAMANQSRIKTAPYVFRQEACP